MNQRLKQRINDATSGTQFGAILAAALGNKIPAPYFSGRATVTCDNFLMANFVDRNGEGHMGAFVGSVGDLVRNAEGLAKHLSLNAEDKAELFSAIRKWVATDYSGGRSLKALEVA